MSKVMQEKGIVKYGIAWGGLGRRANLRLHHHLNSFGGEFFDNDGKIVLIHRRRVP